MITCQELINRLNRSNSRRNGASKCNNQRWDDIFWCQTYFVNSILYWFKSTVFGSVPPTHYLKAYIYRISHYGPSVKIMDLVSDTTYTVYVNFNISGETYNLNSTLNDKFFEKLFMAILFALRVSARNTFCIWFWCLACGSNPGFTINKPTHDLLDYGDFYLQVYGGLNYEML